MNYLKYMLKEKISTDYMSAFRAKNTVAKNLLSVIKGEIQTIEKNTGESPFDLPPKLEGLHKGINSSRWMDKDLGDIPNLKLSATYEDGTKNEVEWVFDSKHEFTKPLLIHSLTLNQPLLRFQVPSNQFSQISEFLRIFEFPISVISFILPVISIKFFCFIESLF